VSFTRRSFLLAASAALLFPRDLAGDRDVPPLKLMGVNGFVAEPWLTECASSSFHLRIGMNCAEWRANPPVVFNTIHEATMRGVGLLPILYWQGSRWSPPRSAGAKAIWRAYCRHVAATMRDHGQPPVFEIWNEPNRAEYWDTGAVAPVESYCDDVVRPARLAIKDEWPSAWIVCGGLAFGNRRRLRRRGGRDVVVTVARDASDFIDGIGRQGFGGLFTGFSVHPYGKTDPDTHRRVANDAQNAFKALEEFRRCQLQTSKPLFVTETGRSTRQGWSQEEQRSFLQGLMAGRIANWPMKDPEPTANVARYYWSGLFTSSGAPKLAGEWWRAKNADLGAPNARL
jgi:hypothetical protein